MSTCFWKNLTLGARNFRVANHLALKANLNIYFHLQTSMAIVRKTFAADCLALVLSLTRSVQTVDAEQVVSGISTSEKSNIKRKQIYIW
jgi:hypothetical protein